MAKTMLGIDIGQNRLKLVLMNGAQVKKAAIADMPEQLVKNGRVVSVETMGELIRETMKSEHIGASKAAVILSGDNVFVRNVTMPQMTEKQLEYNLPFEFRDYIQGELKDYAFDYAMISTPEEMAAQVETVDEETGEKSGKSMELLTVACPMEQINELRQILRKAGLKMVKAAPAVCSYAPLLEAQDPNSEYCILDLGYSAIRMYVFHGTKHMVTRVLETGLSVLDEALASRGNIDVHLAHTYLLTNHENCQSSEELVAAFNNIAVELMRALNFYRFSNPDSNLSGMWLSGGGSEIAPLCATIQNTLDIPVHLAQELLDNGDSIEDCNSLIQAIGITQY